VFTSRAAVEWTHVADAWHLLHPHAGYGAGGATVTLIIHIITRCSRPANLPAVLDSIEQAADPATSVRVVWHVIYDLNRVPIPAKPGRVSPSPHVQIVERFGCGTGPCGYNLVNTCLDEISDGVVYCLDDDNLLHPNVLARIESAFTDPNVGVVVVQQRFGSRIRLIGPDIVRKHNIDLAQFAIRSALMNDRRYLTDDYAADGAMMEDLWRADQSKFTFIHEVLSYYNALA
jgi:hypothetical protein